MSSLRSIVKLAGEGTQGTEPGKHQGSNARVSSDGNNDIGLAATNALQGLAKGMGTGGTGCGYRQIWAFGTVCHCDDIRRLKTVDRWNKVWVHAMRSLRLKEL